MPVFMLPGGLLAFNISPFSTVLSGSGLSRCRSGDTRPDPLFWADLVLFGCSSFGEYLSRSVSSNSYMFFARYSPFAHLLFPLFFPGCLTVLGLTPSTRPLWGLAVLCSALGSWPGAVVTSQCPYVFILVLCILFIESAS